MAAIEQPAVADSRRAARSVRAFALPAAPARAIAALSVMLVTAMLVLLTAHTVADPDLWGHLAFGRDTLATGAIVRPDSYSYVSGRQPWVNHEWLFEVASWVVYAGGGARGLIMLKLCLLLPALGLIYRHLVRSGLSGPRAAVLLLVALPSMQPWLSTMRPQLATFFCFTVTLYALCSFESYRSPILWLLPPLFALWANLHGGFMAGVALLGVWLAVRSVLLLLERPWPAGRPASYAVLELGPVLLSLAATLGNPYGAGLWQFLLRTATVPRPDITEWQGLALVSLYGACYLALLALGLAALFLGRTRCRPALMVIFVCLAPAPVVSIRHLPLFAVAAAMIAAEPLGDAWRRLRGACAARPLRGACAARPLWKWAALAAGSSLAGLALLTPLLSRIDPRPDFFPTEAVDLIQRKVHGAANLAVEFNWGEYALWRLGPDIKVSVDGRRETVYSKDEYELSLHFLSGKGRWDALLEEHPTDLALVYRDGATFNLLTLKPGWELVYEDSLSAVFVNAASPLATQLRRYDRRYPGP